MNTYSVPPTYVNQGVQTTLTPPTGTNSASEPDFKDLLTLLILGMSGSTGTDQSGSSMGALMAPLMIGLLEKLLSNQINSQSTTPASPAQAPAKTVAKAPTSDSAAAPGATQGTHNSPSGRPVGGVITQMPHAGHVAIDFAVPVGTDVHATMDGKVIYAGWNNQGYGNLVIVENGPYKTYFAHLSKIPVSVGDRVKKGEVVGISGNTGNSTGPHVHYEVRLNGVAIDPTKFTLSR
jgi:murein DD-endopeptidase MepM/ murein hydrolase activator NlpD